MSQTDILSLIRSLSRREKAVLCSGLNMWSTKANEKAGIPAMIVSDQGQATLQIGLRSFMSAELTSWGPLMAAAVLASLPILILYLLLQKQVIQSFVKWGIK